MDSNTLNLQQDYNVYADEIEISFKCPKCGKITKYKQTNLPLPNLVVEEEEESEERLEDVLVKCAHCDYSFDVDIIARPTEGLVVINQESNNKMPKDLKVTDYIESPKVHSNNNNDVSIMFDSSSGTTQSVIVTLEELNTAYITTLNQLSKK